MGKALFASPALHHIARVAQLPEHVERAERHLHTSLIVVGRQVASA